MEENLSIMMFALDVCVKCLQYTVHITISQTNHTHTHKIYTKFKQTQHIRTHTHTQWITGKGIGIAKDIPKTLFICSQIPMRGTGLYAVAINMLVYEAMLMI